MAYNPDYTWRIHRDAYPLTDAGYTWVECMWYEFKGKQISPTIPSAGCCERYTSLPGGPITCDISAEQRRYCGDDEPRTVKSETIHDDGYYRVGAVCIVRDEGISRNYGLTARTTDQKTTTHMEVLP